MSDVLGREDPRFSLSPSLELTRRERWVGFAALAVLVLGVLVARAPQPVVPTLLVAADQVLRVDTAGHRIVVPLPAGQAPAQLLRLGPSRLLLTRPAGQSAGGSAWLLGHGSSSLRRLGPADDLVPDARGDRVWTVSGAAVKTLVAFDARGHQLGTRRVTVEQDLLMVTATGVLDDEVGIPGGATPTLRTDSGEVLRRLNGPVRVLDVVGSSVLVTEGACFDGCTARLWDLRSGVVRSAPLGRGYDVLQGRISPDGRAVAFAARRQSLQSMTGSRGEAVLLRSDLRGPLQRAVVTGGCTLLSCHLGWRGSTVYASVDWATGAFVTWPAHHAAVPLRVRIPGVVDLTSL